MASEESMKKVSAISPRVLFWSNFGNIIENSFDKAPLVFFKRRGPGLQESVANERASDLESTRSLFVRSIDISAVPGNYE
jgi:hypothetical protein